MLVSIILNLQMTGVVVEPEQPPIVGSGGEGGVGGGQVGYYTGEKTESEKATERLLKKLQKEDEEILIFIESFTICNN